MHVAEQAVRDAADKYITAKTDAEQAGFRVSWQKSAKGTESLVVSGGPAREEAKPPALPQVPAAKVADSKPDATKV